jgi:hypothetical protein
MTLPKPPADTTTDSMVKWLNGIADTWDAQTNKTEIQLEIGEFFLKSPVFFNGSYDHAIKIYQTLHEDGKPGRRGTPFKYQAIKDIRDHDSLSAAFKGSKSDLYLDLLIRVAGIKAYLKDKEPTLKAVSPANLVGLASLITNRKLRVVNIPTLAKKASQSSDEDFADYVSNKLAEPRPRKTKDTATKIATSTVMAVDVKALERVLAKVQKSAKDMRKSANDMRKMNRDMDDIFSDLITEIKSAIKLGK